MHLADLQDYDDNGISVFQKSLTLKAFPAFTELSAPDLALMAQHTRERFFEAGEVMLHPDAPAQAFFLVITGQVQMLADGRPTKVMSDRETVGALAMLTGTVAHAVALGPVHALEIDNEDMQDVFDDSFTILSSVLASVANTLREARLQLGVFPVEDGAPVVEAGPSGELDLVDKMFLVRAGSGLGTPRIEVLADLALSAVTVRFRAGDRIWARGDRSDHWLLVVSGRIHCDRDDAEAATAGPRSVLGPVDALADKPRSHGAQALTDVVALRTTRSGLFDAVEDHPETAMALIRTLARGITEVYAGAGPPPAREAPTRGA